MLTALEQEVVEWALGGFQPAGSEGLEPSPGTEVRPRVYRGSLVPSPTLERWVWLLVYSKLD